MTFSTASALVIPSGVDFFGVEIWATQRAASANTKSPKKTRKIFLEFTIKSEFWANSYLATSLLFIVDPIFYSDDNKLFADR